MSDRYNRVEAESILRFLDSIIVKPDNFRHQITSSLSDVFGYYKSILWLVDEDSKKLCDPVYLNLRDNAVDLYISKFSELDFLNPYKLPVPKIRTEAVVNLHDIVSHDDFVCSPYYAEFFKRFNERYQIGTYLFEENRIIGVLFLVRNENDIPFDNTDKQRLRIISRHLSRSLASNMLFTNLRQNSISKSDLCQSQVALIVFDRYLKVYHHNQAAIELCQDLLPSDKQNMTPHQFLSILLQDRFFSWRSGIKFTMMSPNWTAYTIHIVPEHKNGFSQPEFFTLYLYANTDQDYQNKKYEAINERETKVKLTSREHEVVRLVMDGLTNSEIANRLFISVPTVKVHLKNVFKKLDVPNRTSLCRKLRQFWFPC